MMFLRFIFSFLYTRNWYTGTHELSRPRVAIFAATLFLMTFGLLIVALLQAPVDYAQGGV